MRGMQAHRGRLIVNCLVVLTWVSITGPLYAFQLMVSPPTVELAVQPGKIIDGSLVVSGQFDRPTRIRATAGCWHLSRDGNVAFIDGQTVEPRSLAGWLMVAPAEFTLSDQRAQLVRYRLKVPDDITGGYWGALFFQNVRESPSSTKGTAALNIVGRVAVLFQVQTQSGAIRDGVLVNLIGSWSKEGLMLWTTFENRGNLIVKARGRFELIVPKTGKTAARIPIAEALVLPGGVRDLTAKYTGTLAPGTYLVRAVVDYGNPRAVAAQRVIKVGG